MLGALTYLVFPRDINVPDARELVQTDSYFIKFVDHNGYICIRTNHPQEDNCN